MHLFHLRIHAMANVNAFTSFHWFAFTLIELHISGYIIIDRGENEIKFKCHLPNTETILIRITSSTISDMLGNNFCFLRIVFCCYL